MRDSLFRVTRLPQNGKKLGGGYTFIGDILPPSRKTPKLAPVRPHLKPGPYTKIRKLSSDGFQVLSKLRYKNVFYSRRVTKPRRKILRTTGRPRARARLSLLSDMLNKVPKLTKDPIYDFSYFGRASFRVWVVYWYWGLSQKRAHESRIVYNSVRPSNVSFSKWPRSWIGPRYEHKYIKRKAGCCLCIYHADTNSMVDVLSVITHTVASGHLRVEVKVWPMIWINGKLIFKEELVALISESILTKLRWSCDWPPLDHFSLNTKSKLILKIIESYCNNSTIDFYDNVVVCSYQYSKSGMTLVKHTWKSYIQYIPKIERIDNLKDRKLLSIPSTIPVEKFSIPSTEALWPRKRLFPSYFLGHNAPTAVLEQLRKSAPWAVRGDDVILIYNRFKKKGHRSALTQLSPSYYKDGLSEAMRTDIRGMRYDIRMVESVAHFEKRLLGLKLNWQPPINLISLGTWQALPHMFNKTYWLGFGKIINDTTIIANHEVDHVCALFTQVYSTSNQRIGLGIWPWTSLSVLQHGTWRIGFSSPKVVINYITSTVQNFKWVYCLNKPCNKHFAYFLIEQNINMIKLQYMFPNNKPWLIFFDINRARIGIALTMLAYFTLDARNSSNKLRCWGMENKQLPCTFFDSNYWTASGHFTSFKTIKHIWQTVKLAKLIKQFNRNSWTNNNRDCRFSRNVKSMLLYSLVTIRSTLRLQYNYEYLSRLNYEVTVAQSCSIWLHLANVGLTYPNMRPIKTILNNWTKFLNINNLVSLPPIQMNLPVELCSAKILRTWLQIRPFVTYKQQLGFRSLFIDAIGFPMYNIGKLRMLYTQAGRTSAWNEGFAAWPKWLGYGRGWTGHLVGNWVSPESLTGFTSPQLRSTVALSINRDVIPFKDNGYWIYIFFRAPLGTWQALAVTSLIITELRSFPITSNQVRIWHGGLLLPEDFCNSSSWDNFGRYRWPERLLLIWHRTTIAWVERRVRGRRRYNRRYSKMPSETIARAIRVQCIRIRFPDTAEGLSLFNWTRQHYIYPYGLVNRAFFLHKAEVEISLRWSQMHKLLPISGEEE